MSKRYFKIDTGRYGGEIVVGKVSPEFVEYWKDRDRDDLLRHVLNLDWDDEEEIDQDSPEMTESGNISWHEVDDYEHLTGPYSDNKFLVYEVDLVPGVKYENGEITCPEDWDYSKITHEEITDYEQYDYTNYIYGREVYTSDPTADDDGDWVPVLQMHSAEKGGFGEIFIETNGEDFNPEKLAIGIVETDMGELIEAYWYDGREVVVDYDACDTVGKSFHACVGWMNEKWYDRPADFTPDSDNVKESLEEIFFAE